MEHRRRLPAHEETEQTGEMSYGRIWAGHGFLGLLGSDPREAQVEKKVRQTFNKY